MVARGDKPPCFNLNLDLDNKALKSKNNGLIQTVAKLQQDNAELLKQVTVLQGETFDLKSRYNNLKNVISIIDSTTKTCLPKLNEVVETFTGIIQLCSVAGNITGLNRDTRTQAVKPQIVNGHVLHNPTITLSRLSSDNTSYTPPRPSTSRITSSIVIRPSTSQGTNNSNGNGNSQSNGSREEDSDGQSQIENRVQEDEEEDSSFICHANRGVCSRKKFNTETLRPQEVDSEVSDEESETPLVEEEEEEEETEDEEVEENQSDQRLTTIGEDEESEEEEEAQSPKSRSPRRRFLKGRLQEVKIYLNQLPPTFVNQVRSSGNISISVSPPDRRSSYKHRPSSLVGETNGSFLDENISVLSTVRMEDFNLEEASMTNNSTSKLSVTFKNSASAKTPCFESSCSSSSDEMLQFPKTLSPIHNLPTVTPRSSSSNDSKEMPSLQELGLVSPDNSQRRTSTPISRRSSGSLFSPSASQSRSSKSATSISFKTNVTKRRVTSRENKKVAQVLLDRLSGENGNGGAPYDVVRDMVKSPMITRRSQIKTRSKGKSNFNNATCSEEENVENNAVAAAAVKMEKKSKTPGVKKIKKEPLTPNTISPSKKSPKGRPKRAARPISLREPSLTKKMRRSR